MIKPTRNFKELTDSSSSVFIARVMAIIEQLAALDPTTLIDSQKVWRSSILAQAIPIAEALLHEQIDRLLILLVKSKIGEIPL